MPTSLERALARFRRVSEAEGEPVSARVSAAEFRAATEQRLRALEREVAEVKGRVNGLIFVVAGAGITQVVLRLAGEAAPRRSPPTRPGESHRSIPLPAKARLKPGLRPRNGTGAISGTYPLTNENARSIIRIAMAPGTSVRLLRLRPYQCLPGLAIVESALGQRGLTFTVVMARQAGKI